MSRGSLSALAAKALVLTHRWLGIGGGLLFVAWFVSGIVMVFARMPAVDPADRLARLPALDLTAATVSPWEAAVAAEVDPQRVRMGMLLGRPVYRLARGAGWVTVYADTGRPLVSLDPQQALDIAGRWAPKLRSTSRHEGLVTEPDQWTLLSRDLLPLHLIGLGDAAATRISVSGTSGEIVMETTASSRRWATCGAVLHWLYFTPIRSHGLLWNRVLLGAALVGCVLTLSGLAWGVWQIAPKRRDGRSAGTPYTGLLRWHHYAGLVFGLFTFGWALSGALSLDPWRWHPGSSPSRQQSEAVAGGRLRFDLLTLERIRAAHAALGADFSPRELEVIQLGGHPHLLAYSPNGAPRPRAALTPSDIDSPVQPFPSRIASLETLGGYAASFDRHDIEAAADRAMPRHRATERRWLDAYDAYHYDRHGLGPLPVLRVKYDDPQSTWLYLDPATGRILQRLQRLSRLNRWLYRGLHSLDFPLLYARPVLWHFVIIILLAGGLLLSSTTLLPGWRRLRRRFSAR
ncbi:MAG: hypothetical protein VYE73_15860 [Acidobacteriota bacterium]|nr:hypothetical protein [Acidobacteriota bacterium]